MMQIENDFYIAIKNIQYYEKIGNKLMSLIWNDEADRLRELLIRGDY